MTPNLGPLAGVVAAGLLLAAVACGTTESTRPSTTGTEPTPDVQATLTALAQGVERGIPTATAVPDAVRRATINFAISQRATVQVWDQFHTEFDSWREGLIACNPNLVQSSLQGFAGRFAEVTKTARSLPRQTVVRGWANTLIEAAEQEEASLRQLRDTWQPGDLDIPPLAAVDDTTDNGDGLDTSALLAGVSEFEAVDIARTSTSMLRQRVSDELTDRRARTAPESLKKIGEFVAVFNTTDAEWDTFHQDYDSFRSIEGQLTSEETIARLGLLIDQFRNIVITIRQVPTTAATRDVADALTQAARDEDLALRRLRGTFQLDGESTNGDTGALGENDTASSAETSEEGSGAGFTAANPVFDALDAQLVESNSTRTKARRTLEDILEDISDETEIIVEDFGRPYQLLLQAWDDFHDDYDEWRQTEGGCNRSKAVDTLGRFAGDFGEIANNIRNIPTATVLRPLGEILVEAAEREERGLRALRDIWQPYDVDVYGTLEQERSTAGKLRRQVAVGVQDLLERFGISPDELE